MSDTLSLDVRAALAWLRQETLPLSTVADAARLDYAKNLSHGAGSAQVDALWHGSVLLAPSAQQDLDLTALESTLFGDTLVTDFATIKALLVINTATSEGDDLLVGGAGSNGWAAPLNDDTSAELVVAADSTLLLVNRLAGWPVGESSKLLRIANIGSGSITAQIVLAGTAAE